ncbi:hypothetical protein [Rhodococcus sp. NPDC049939]|uniref:hypothetical protein n=1 Tax=Rhodococcus sp. NPDC049939 TaxID=3155511 RepID=UPI0033E3146F
MPAARMKKFASAAVTTVAATATVALAAPTTASAGPVDVKPAEVTASSTGTTLNISISNPNNFGSAVYCNAAVVDASSVPAIVEDPWTIFDEGVLVYPTLAKPETFFGVYPGDSESYTVPDLEPGYYGVLGACLTVWNVGDAPTLNEPQVLLVSDLDLGSVGSSEIPAFGS